MSILQSLLQNIDAEVADLKVLLSNLRECSNIVRWNFSSIMTMTGDYQWERLNDHGQKIQNQLLTQYERFIQILRFLTTGLPGEQQRMLDTLGQAVFDIIKQNKVLFNMDKESWFTSAAKALDRQFQMISAEYQVTNDCCLLVPDVDILLANFELEQWQFKEINKFRILLLPTVVNELNKITKSNNQVTNKIDQYTKQNRVSVVNSVENLEETLSWLSLNDIHDRIIAGYLEIFKINPHSQVVLLTNTMNLQEKARSFNVPYITLTVLKNESVPVNPDPPDHQAKPEVPSNTANAKPVAVAAPVGKPATANTPVKVALPPPVLNKPIPHKPMPNKPRAAKPKPDIPRASIKAKQVNPSASNRAKPTR